MGPWGGAVALGFVAVAAVAQVGGPEASALGFGAAVVAPAADGRGRWVYAFCKLDASFGAVIQRRFNVLEATPERGKHGTL